MRKWTLVTVLVAAIFSANCAGARTFCLKWTHPDPRMQFKVYCDKNNTDPYFTGNFLTEGPCPISVGSNTDICVHPTSSDTDVDHFMIAAFDPDIPGSESVFSGVITADWTAPSYTVSTSITTGGTITPSAATSHFSGSVPVFTLTPDTGYQLTSLTGCGGTLSGNTYTAAPVSGTCTVSAVFSLIQYTVTASIAPALNGSSVSCTSPVNYGSSSTCSFTLPQNTNIIGLTDTTTSGTTDASTSLTGGNTYTINNIHENHAVLASMLVYTVTPASASNGTITPPTPLPVSSGRQQVFTLTPAANYHIASVSGCGGTLSGNTFTTAPVTGDCAVTPQFAINTFAMSGISGTGGTVTPTSTTASHGSSQTFAITPSYGYHILSVTDNGVYVGAPASYTVSNITTGHIISAIFSNALNTYRFRYKPTGSAYLLTADVNEKNALMGNSNWVYEGISFNNACPGSQAGVSPVYRFRSNTTGGSYLFTINVAEKNYITSYLGNLWTYEGISFYAYSSLQPGTKTVHRFRSLQISSYLLTADEVEVNSLMANPTWTYEGPAFYAPIQ